MGNLQSAIYKTGQVKYSVTPLPNTVLDKNMIISGTLPVGTHTLNIPNIPIDLLLYPKTKAILINSKNNKESTFENTNKILVKDINNIPNQGYNLIQVLNTEQLEGFNENPNNFLFIILIGLSFILILLFFANYKLNSCRI